MENFSHNKILFSFEIVSYNNFILVIWNLLADNLVDGGILLNGNFHSIFKQATTHTGNGVRI